MSARARITVKIGALVLHGVSYPEVGPLTAALRQELGRLLAERHASLPGSLAGTVAGAPAALAGAPPRRAHIDAGTFASALGRTGAGVGRTAAAATDGGRIAGNVYRGLTGGTAR